MSEGGGKKPEKKPHYKYPSHGRKRSARSRSARFLKKRQALEAAMRDHADWKNIPGPSTQKDDIPDNIQVDENQENIPDNYFDSSSSSECVVTECVLDDMILSASPPDIVENQPSGSEPVLENISFILEEEYDSIMEHELTIEPQQETTTTPVSGNRIVEIGFFTNRCIELQYKHSKNCTLGLLQLHDEIRWGVGLVSKLILKCNLCDKEYNIMTEDPKNRKSKINIGAVWGTLAVGSTYGHLEETLCIMDIPPLSLYTFKQIEADLADLWKDTMFLTIEENGRMEKQLAIENNDVDKADGLPFITVYLDGGWSKRSYGHSYNAASGTAVIIGKRTNKLLYLGVRNKYCSICARAANKQIPPGGHVCYKNWYGSSAAMEADIIVQGFQKSQEMHGVKYKKFIADGDSSVYAKIREKVSYGYEVEKVECTNHVIKNYGKALRRLKQDKLLSLDGRKLLTGKIINALEKRVQDSIYDNAGNSDPESLKKDIVNSPLHVFGDHRKCSPVYCDEIGHLDEQALLKVKKCSLLLHIQGAIDNVLKKAHKLLDNETNNRAELYMAILARFNAGKRLNLIQRGSFETRSYMAGLRYDSGVKWHVSALENYLGTKIGKYLQKYIDTQTQARLTKSKSSQSKSYKMSYSKYSGSKDYGPKAEQAELTKEEFDSELSRKLQDLQISSKEEQEEIAEATIGQFDNTVYILRRRNRLTASLFGEVCKRLQHTPCHNLVKKIIKPLSITTAAIEYGKQNEAMVRAKYSHENNVVIRECGLYIDTKRGYLAASPDGRINRNKLVEIKCLYKAAKEKWTLHDAVKEKKIPCLEYKENSIRLKTSHNYFYQIQGQLNITGREHCLFIVYSGEQNPLFVETVTKNEEFWETKMLPKLEKFYLECVLPEIVRGNIEKGLKCVDPPYILEAQRKKQQVEEIPSFSN